MEDIKAYKKKVLINIMDFVEIYNNKQLKIIKTKKLKSNKMFYKKKMKPLKHRKNEINISNIEKRVYFYI